MTNPYYNETFTAALGSQARSRALDNEFQRIQAAFDALDSSITALTIAAGRRFTLLEDCPSTLTAAGLKLVRVNAAASALEFVAPGNVSVRTVSGTGYTLVAGDSGGVVLTSNAAAVTVTVPPDVFSQGDVVCINQYGAGQVTVAEGSGVTVLSSDNLMMTRAQYAQVALVCLAANVFALIGERDSTAAVTSLPDVTDPSAQWYGPSGVTIDTVASQACGDPFIVRDDTNSQWIMYLWRTVTGSPYVRQYYRTLAYSSTIHGTWSAATEIPSLAGYHKGVLLVDEDGAPVQVGGSYHLYAPTYSGTLDSKEIWHFTASTLTGTWTLGSKVIAKGASGTKDEYNTDTPYAIYNGGTIYLWYMGAPASSLATYGYATRMLRATATAADGPFTKSTDDVIAPATAAAWNYGWLGGTQIRRRPVGGYIMVFNAGDTRPSGAGLEPNTSRAGYAYASSLDGPWTQDLGNPYFTATDLPSDSVEATNIWRVHIAFDHTLRQWASFYNSGSGTEKITYAKQGAYDYAYTSIAPPYDIQAVTTSVVAVTNSKVPLPAGVYRVDFRMNLIGNSASTATPKLDIDTVLRVNGTDFRTNRDYIGNYAYENRDTALSHIVTLPAGGTVDLTVQATAGTPVATTYARRLRVSVNRL